MHMIKRERPCPKHPHEARLAVVHREVADTDVTARLQQPLCDLDGLLPVRYHAQCIRESHHVHTALGGKPRRVFIARICYDDVHQTLPTVALD
eukprot:50911-Eustigmatos_ZCMA.PRE.1